MMIMVKAVDILTVEKKKCIEISFFFLLDNSGKQVFEGAKKRGIK